MDGQGTSADCWAMGVLAYNLVRGRPPFGAEGTKQGGGRAQNVAAILAGEKDSPCFSMQTVLFLSVFPMFVPSLSW
jgi:hypothetical protein